MRICRPFIFARWLFPDAIFRFRQASKTLFLTFDDGPDPVSTPSLLRILSEAGVKAVFFCCGRKAEEYPGLISQIRAEGHVIASHGYSHLDGWKTPAKIYIDDADRASSVIGGILFRPPFGRLTPRQYLNLRKKNRIVFWDVMPYDFDPEFGSSRSLNLLKKKIRSGSVIVLHDTSASDCPEFLGGFIRHARNEGYSFDLIH